ncbi:hypothetical protein BC938DRAFT_476077 [Jimgerdemannia flammicorona]|uniref:F-box domain-containing protein n=1 Tax=Jimgerdemannia flammicorona TaxID=994334 RepID=A0A433QQX5_9FUNG|nr:hypothetical protein BC938DRAFT_476077 [Jimgerdemannia flammicorona]
MLVNESMPPSPVNPDPRAPTSQESLPNELFLCILIHLSPNTVYHCSVLSRRFYQLTIPYLWRYLQPSSLRSWQGIINTLRSPRAADYGPCVNRVDFSALSPWEAQQVTDGMLVTLLTECQNIGELSLVRLQQLSAITLQQVATRADKLEMLDLSACSQFSTGDLQTLFIDPGTPSLRRYPKLTTIDLSSCSLGVSDNLIQSIAHVAPRLRHLHLCRSGNVSDNALASVAQHCPDLEVLVITLPKGLIQSNKITDAAVRALAQGCKKLKIVVGRGQTRVTDAGVAMLTKECRDLERVDFSLKIPGNAEN